MTGKKLPFCATSTIFRAGVAPPDRTFPMPAAALESRMKTATITAIPTTAREDLRR